MLLLCTLFVILMGRLDAESSAYSNMGDLAAAIATMGAMQHCDVQVWILLLAEICEKIHSGTIVLLSAFIF